MNNKERFDFNRKNGLTNLTEIQVIEILVNRLIENLYKPTTTEITFRVDPFKLDEMEIDRKEPINWGDLKCIEVVKDNASAKDLFIVIIDEAAPDDCKTFCNYIEKYLKAWGWNIRVITEW